MRPPSPPATSAVKIATLEELRAALDKFEGCALRATATQLVFADGNPQARVMLVGEAPGRDEDIEGLPFVGRSGKAARPHAGGDRARPHASLYRQHHSLAAAGQPHTDAAGIRRSACRSCASRSSWSILTCLCVSAGLRRTTLLGIKDGITKTRGRWFTFNTGTREIRAMPTFHPAFLLRSPLQKRLAWRDFLAMKKALAG